MTDTDTKPVNLKEHERIKTQLTQVTAERDKLRAEAAEARRMKSPDPLPALANKLAPGTLLERACVRLAEHHSGFPGGGGGTASGTGDRTGHHAQLHVDGERGAKDKDGVELGRVELTDTKYRDMLKLLQQADKLVSRVMPSTQAADHTATLTEGPPGCVSHARFKDSLGRPMFAPKWGKLDVCRTCQRDLATVRARESHRDITAVPESVLRWRDRFPSAYLTSEVLDRILAGGVR